MYKRTSNQISALAVSAILAGSASHAQDTVNLPVPPNAEPDTGPVDNSSGFVLSLDGETIDADPQIEDRVRKADIALAEADVQIQLDPVDPVTRLDVEIAGPPQRYRPGDSVTLISESNYPAYLARGEMRIIDRGAAGGPRLLTVVPVEVNGHTSLVLPQGRDVVVVHRVYDDKGRYDETRALALFDPDDRGQLDDVEEGSQYTGNRNIRVKGSTVTVSATNVAQGAVLETLGERVRPDPNGRLVIERILPVGDHVVDVTIAGGGQYVDLTRPIEVPGSEWFYVAVADLTFGRYSSGSTGNKYTEAKGRFQYYVEGETVNGYRITSSLDTGEEELENIFKRLDDKDPNDIIERIDPNSGYATYGDDSTIVDNTPTSGKFYLRIERDNNFVLWGDVLATLDGNGLIRNERNVYGAQVHLESQKVTAHGDAKTTFDAYAAQPDQSVGRDVFRGTGGSVYFLSHQDIEPGTEVITAQLRDDVTGRVIETVSLVEGRDYQINEFQGLVTLNEPLSATLDRRLISSTVGGDETITLIVQYEFTPTTGDIDGFSFGGRAEHWLTDDFRIGFSAISDDDGIDRQTSGAVDLRYRFGANSFVQLDYARSEGPGFDTTFSNDGGFIFDTQPVVDGDGEAIKLEAQFDLKDLGSKRTGIVGGYFEDRTEGFTSLDYQVSASTGDETLYGLFAIIEPEENSFGFSFYLDGYENDVGDDRLEIGAELASHLTERLSFAAAIEHLDEVDLVEEIDGNRTDVALKLAYLVTPEIETYVFGQVTVANNGLHNNDRYGAGLSAALGKGWTVGAEVSDGYGGFGASLLATKLREDNSSVYFGYELDPGRALDAGISKNDNGGRYVAGSRRHINEKVSVFGEQTYDIFGTSRETIGAYGVTYKKSDYLSYTLSYDLGQLRDRDDGDIDRQAVSLGMRYDDDRLRAAGRIELRFDDYEDASVADTEAYFFVADAEYRISEESRLLFNLDYAETRADGNSFEDGRYVDAVLGFAHRPIFNERLNVLATYRYFFDDVGQEIDGQSDAGAVQETHVMSIEANYDLNPHWTIGGKLGGRWSESAFSAGEVLTDNDAWLAVANARYHLVHNWDLLIEARHLELSDAGLSSTGFLGAAYYHINNNAKVGVGYNFTDFSDDLTDLSYDNEGIFINLIAKY
ncbi:hypothetical protein [Sulfitobacter sp.]|uniref:hypothetical protein n=1 Tax=Sulfitobacter sp. TaxID=1903071 RepID=UPI003297E154